MTTVSERDTGTEVPRNWLRQQWKEGKVPAGTTVGIPLVQIGLRSADRIGEFKEALYPTPGHTGHANAATLTRPHPTRPRFPGHATPDGPIRAA